MGSVIDSFTWLRRKKDKYTSISSVQSISLGISCAFFGCESPVQKIESSKANGISQGKFETSNDDNYSDATDHETLTLCTKSNVHHQRGKNYPVHVQSVSSLWAGTEEHKCNRSEIEKYGDIEMLSEFCTNSRRIKEADILWAIVQSTCVGRC